MLFTWPRLFIFTTIVIDCLKAGFPLGGILRAERIFSLLVISRVELIRKDKENFRCARKIAPSGKPA
jgi:hypothetical protein